MRLFDAEGRRLYVTEDERRAFGAAAAKAPREVRTFCGTPHAWSRVTASDALVPWVRVCRVWRTARSTVYRHRAPPPPTEPPRRPGPIGAMPECGAGGGDPWRPRRQPLPRRGALQAPGQAAPGGVRTCDTALEFRGAYDASWPIERHGFRPPSAVR